MQTNRIYTLTIGLTAVVAVTAAFGGGAAATVYLAKAPERPAPSYPGAISLAPEAVLGKAAVLYDPTSNRILFQKNAAAQLPLASLTKLMTAEVVLSQAPKGATVRITQEDLKPEGDWGFAPGQEVALDDLIRFGLVASSNDAMAAAAASIGDPIIKMNAQARALGLTKTYFLNPTGLDISSSIAGAYGSAYDVARLAAAFMEQYPEYFERTTEEAASVTAGSQNLSAAATALPIQDMPGFIGAKTGYTDLAGGNLVAAFDLDIGHPVLAVVLGSTHDGRFEDIRTMINALRAQQ